MHYLRILDRHTEIFCAVFVITPRNMNDRRLMDYNGWGQDPNHDYLFLMKLAGSRVEVQWDPYNSGDRTMATAHHWLCDQWRTKGFEHLGTLDIVDVQTILKERV